MNPKSIVSDVSSRMRKYPGSEFDLWVQVDQEPPYVKKLSFAGNLQDHEKVILEAVASLVEGKDLSQLENLSLRECEAFLRDRNSEMALENLAPETEGKFKKLFSWMRLTPQERPVMDYQYSVHKGPFRNLKLIDKIRELKAFLNSPEIKELYQGSLLPELVDVEDLTVFVQAPYRSERDRALFEELHLLGVSTFQEESLNFIPEA